MDFPVAKRRSARQVDKRSTYYESDLDNESVGRRSTRQATRRKRSLSHDLDPDERAVTRRSARKSSRSERISANKRLSYYESDLDEDVELLADPYYDGPDRYAVPPPPSPSPPPQPRPVSQRPRKRAKSDRKSQSRSHNRKRTAAAKPKTWQKGWSKPLGAFKTKSKEFKAVGASIPSDGLKPNWASLPVDILRDIFIFASQPFHDQTVESSANATWLMKTAHGTCHALAVPALEAYYLAPAFHTLVQPHHLLELAQLPVDETYIKYRLKVKRLEINVKQLAYTAYGRQAFDLSALVREVPQMQQLEVTNPTHKPPYRPLQFQKWYYPRDLFDAIEETGTRLRTWRWSRDMMQYGSTHDMYGNMTRVHSGRSFEHLQHLVVCGFDFNDNAEQPPAEDGERQFPTLTSAISVLPNVKNLTFISCDVIMEDFLLRLPDTLQGLELTNCLEIHAGMLQTYLTTNGSHLRELVLNSNAALSLEFLPSLKATCPKLETLKMDTMYYSERTNYNDAYAFYDQLLTPSNRPTWPSALRHLELTSLQKWDAAAASVLFQSLIESAPDLPGLRHLTIQAHIDIAWRDRANFRDKWVDKLRGVFLHKTAPPLPYLCSIKRYRERQEEQGVASGKSGTSKSEAGKSTTELDTEEEEPPRRSLSHVRITPRKRAAFSYAELSDAEDEDDDEDIESESQDARVRRSVRVAESQPAATGQDESEKEPEDEPEVFVQGLCEVVDVRIDNQRPRETQYTEANFIDSEVSGDEDWHSGAELSDEAGGGYAW